MPAVNITINDKQIEVPSGISVLKTAESCGIDIPTLCNSEILNAKEGAACRLCVVEIEGRKNLAPACATVVSPGMVIKTDSDRVTEARKMILELIVANHPLLCDACEKNNNCALQKYCAYYGIEGSIFSGGETKNYKSDTSNNFFDYDANKCILCGNCVRVCSELQRNGAIGRAGRGFETHIAAPFNRALNKSVCVSCGSCVSACPVNALMPKQKTKPHTSETRKVKTTCPYCGVGCQMNLITKDNIVVDVEPLKGMANFGLLCVKGKFGMEFISKPDRLKTPLIKKNGKFEEATWESALNLIAEKITEVKDKYGPDAIGGLSSARVTNEENYLFQKFIRMLGTNNVDHCARLCHASTVTGLGTTLGSGAMTNSNAEILGADVILVSGSNTTKTHPVLGAMMKQAQSRGAKIIVIEPRKIELAQYADVFLQINPGTNVAIYNAIMHVIINEGLHYKDYIEQRTENFEELEALVAEYTPQMAAEICGVNADDIVKAAKVYAKADKAGIFYSMGVTQHTSGTDGVKSVSNLAMLCGNVGIESGGVNPLRGQNNVQGACDLGALPNVYTGYQKVADENVNAKFQKAWGTELSKNNGLTVTEIIKKSGQGDIKFLYIMGENPMISDPDISHVEQALSGSEFVVVQDIFMTETAQLADVILPAASFAEKDGTFTNTERRIQRVRKAIEPTHESKADWEIITALMNKLGMEQTYNHPSEIMDEIAKLTPLYGGVSFERIEQEGLQWPCTDSEHPGTKYLHKEKIARGKGLFSPAPYVPSNELPDEEYPFYFSTGRILYHYHTATMTKRVEGIRKMFPKSFVQIHPNDADKLGISDGDKLTVASRRGTVTTSAKVTDMVKQGMLFMPFHFADGPANMLTNPALDPVAKIPELKVCAAKVVKS